MARVSVVGRLTGKERANGPEQRPERIVEHSSAAMVTAFREPLFRASSGQRFPKVPGGAALWCTMIVDSQSSGPMARSILVRYLMPGRRAMFRPGVPKSLGYDRADPPVASIESERGPVPHYDQ